MRARCLIMIGLLALAACGKRKKEAVPESEAPASPVASGPVAALALADLPATTRVIIGVSIPRIAASTLMRRLLTEAMARDADIRPRIDALLGRCQIDLPRDLTDVTIAKGAATDEVAILAAGHFDAKAIVACVHAEVNDAGSAFRAGALLGVVCNAGAYTHTSVALHDAVKGAGVPVVEVHISNVHAREPFRHHSYLSPVAAGIVVGFGIDGYALAMQALARRGAAPQPG